MCCVFCRAFYVTYVHQSQIYVVHRKLVQTPKFHY